MIIVPPTSDVMKRTSSTVKEPKQKAVAPRAIRVTAPPAHLSAEDGAGIPVRTATGKIEYVKFEPSRKRKADEPEPVPAKAKKQKPALIPASAAAATPVGVESEYVNGTLKIKKPNPDDTSVEDAEVTEEEEEEDIEEEPDVQQEKGEDDEDEGYDTEEADADEEEDESSEDEEDNEDETDPVLRMRFPSTTLINAKKFGGKTTLLTNILDQHVDKFSDVFLIGKSSNTGQLNRFATSDDHIVSTVGEGFFGALLEEQKKIPSSKQNQILLVFDDIGGKDFPYASSPAFNEIITSGRQQKISVIAGLQAYKMMPSVFRENSEFMFFGNNKAGAQKKIVEEQATSGVPPGTFMNILGKIAKDNRRNHKSFFFMDDESQFNTIYVVPPP